MYFFYKRFFDIIFSIILLIFSFPILILSLTAVYFYDFKNPIYVQERSGINGKNIRIYKIRTMFDFNETKKITKIGKYLRLLKLDEIPQIINILKNEMSLIGPRPLLRDFDKFYKKKHKNRLQVKPGITGLAQIKIRNSTNWNRKFNFDVIYVKKISLSLDLYIMKKTIYMIIISVLNKDSRPIESIDYKNDFFENYYK